MAFRRIFRRLAITSVVVTPPMGILIPGVLAKERTVESPTSRRIKPSELPIYEGPEEIFNVEYRDRQPSSLQLAVRGFLQQTDIVNKGQLAATQAVHIFETGKAHTQQTLTILADESTVAPKVGAITIGSLVGLVLATRRGIIKKLLYTSIGGFGTASLCYPADAKEISNDIVSEGKKWSLILYNFLAGAKPE